MQRPRPLPRSVHLPHRGAVSPGLRGQRQICRTAVIRDVCSPGGRRNMRPCLFPRSAFVLGRKRSRPARRWAALFRFCQRQAPRHLQMSNHRRVIERAVVAQSGHHVWGRVYRRGRVGTFTRADERKGSAAMGPRLYLGTAASAAERSSNEGAKWKSRVPCGDGC